MLSGRADTKHRVEFPARATDHPRSALIILEEVVEE